MNRLILLISLGISMSACNRRADVRIVYPANGSSLAEGSEVTLLAEIRCPRWKMACPDSFDTAPTGRLVINGVGAQAVALTTEAGVITGLIPDTLPLGRHLLSINYEVEGRTLENVWSAFEVTSTSDDGAEDPEGDPDTDMGPADTEVTDTEVSDTEVTDTEVRDTEVSDTDQ